MDADRRNDTGIFRYTDVEYTPEGHTDAYRWDDFLGIAGGHVYSAMDTIDMVSTGGQYEGDEPEHAYACEIVGCCGLSDGVALFRPVSHDGADLIQIAFLRNDVDDATGAYTERFEAGSFDLPAADLPRSEFGVDLLEYFSGRSFKYTPGVSRGLDPREAVDSIEDAIGCDLGLFGGVTLNDVPSFGFDDGWDGSCLNRLDWFEDAVGMDPDGLSAGLVANDIESVKALVVNCPAWIECAPSYSEKAARGIDDVVQAVKAYRANAKRVDRKVIPGRIPECLFEGARAAAANTAGGADGGTGLHI